MNIAVFDIETSNFEFTPDPADMTISVVGIWDSVSESYVCYEQKEFPALWKKLEGIDILVGYNSDHFDIPLLNKYYPGDLTSIKSVDMMQSIYASLGRRLRLDAVADGTLGEKKIGHGAQAHVWWSQGEYEKVKQYCLKDVELTKKIFDYALKNGHIKYKELGQVREVKLDTSKWLEKKNSAMTQTLGF